MSLMAPWQVSVAQVDPNAPIPTGDIDFYNRENEEFDLDTTSLDSLGPNAGDRKKIKPDTRLIDRHLFWMGTPEYRVASRMRFDHVAYWDELDTLQGFVQSLGQLGMPFQHWTYGLKERYFLPNQWENPFFRRYNRYILDANHQARYFDTKTPYVDVYLTFGPQRLQSTLVTLSQNITPQWNVSGALRRRLSQSVYRNIETDHVNVHANSNYHSKDERYAAFGTFAYHQLNDVYNGGVPRSTTDGQLIDNGSLIEENGVILNGTFANNFFKAFSEPLLSGVLSSSRLVQLHTDHYFRLWNSQDSVNRPNRITLRGQALAEFMFDRYSDDGISSTLASQPVPVYPTLDPDSNYVIEGFNGQRYKLSGAINYSLAPEAQASKGNVPLRVQAGIELEWRRMFKDTVVASQQLVSPFGRINLTTGPFELGGYLQTRVSNLFAPELDFTAQTRIRPFSSGMIYKIDEKRTAKLDSAGIMADSLASTLSGPDFYPVEVVGNVLFRTINPSIFQSYFTGDSGNVYVPNPDLVNQTVLHGKAGIQWNERTRVSPKDTLQPNFLRLSLFYSQISRQIDYGDSMQVVQAGAGEANQWLGLELITRLRFGRKFHFETRNVAQLNVSQYQGENLLTFTQTQPLVYGKASLYFDSKTLTVAERMRLGLDLHYFTDYQSYAFDEFSGEYFPSRYVITPYARLDAYATLRLMRVYVFARFVHTTEGILTGGYYTTPFHPMLQRSFTFGVNWLFFD